MGDSDSDDFGFDSNEQENEKPKIINQKQDKKVENKIKQTQKNIEKDKLIQNQISIDKKTNKNKLSDKIKWAKNLTEQKFYQLHTDLQLKQSFINEVQTKHLLKNQNDFVQFAKQIGRRFNQEVQDEGDVVNDQCLVEFFEDIVSYLYNDLKWNDMFQINKKIKIIKKNRRIEEQKTKKQREKQDRLKKKNRKNVDEVIMEPKIQKDNLFGGVNLINSKQIQDQLKNKKIQSSNKQEKKPTQQSKQDDDNDDFW